MPLRICFVTANISYKIDNCGSRLHVCKIQINLYKVVAL